MLSQEEFERIIVAQSKCIEGNIVWDKNRRNSSAFEFRIKILSNDCYPLILKGWYNHFAEKLSYAIIYTGFGGFRIYGLDLGEDHQNPDGTKVGRKHKHRWIDKYIGEKFIGDSKAYVPDDITALVNDPIGVWKQFCLESKIIHKGIMHQPQIPKLFL